MWFISWERSFAGSKNIILTHEQQMISFNGNLQEDNKKIKKIEAIMKETGAIEIQIGEYKVKKRRN